MLRDLRRADGPAFFDVMERGFPEESVLLGNRPEEFQRIFERVFRWDTRVLLGLLRMVGRPVVRALVVEVEGHLVATTLVTFPSGCAYVSNVVVDAAHRRKGYARLLLEEARRSARRARRPYLALDVLEKNTAARALYESLGYRFLKARYDLLNDTLASFAGGAPAVPGIRPFLRSDVPALVALARRQTSPEVEKVLPTRKDRFLEAGVVTRMLGSEATAWVVDRGHGPEAHVSASVSRASEAAYLGAPTLAETVDPSLAEALVRTATAWCVRRGAPRVLTMVGEDNPRGRAALEATGFHDARALWTLYRPVD